MRNVAILRFIEALVNSWDVRTARCFGRLVAALMHGGRLGVAAIGRHIDTKTTDKHHIKSVDRFLGHRSVDLVLLWAALVQRFVGEQKRLFVLLDWTDLHDGLHETLEATVSFGGRSLPIAWTTWKKGNYHKSRNAVESSFCLVLKALLPSTFELVVVADRGFARASFLRALRRAGIRFVIRIRKDIHLLDERGCGPVKNRRIRRGQTRDLPEARFGRNARVEVRCVLTFADGVGKNRPKQPWYLITDLSPAELTAHAIVAVYKLRMRIEHNFRDHKSMRFGFQLRSVRLSTAARYDNLLAIAAVALLLLTLVGATVETRGLHRQFKANTDPRRTHSLFQLGLGFLHRLRLRFFSRALFTAYLGQLEGMG